MGDKLEIVGELIADNPQFAVLVAMGVLTLAACRVLRRRAPLAYFVADALAVASIAPNPPFVQDDATIVPFLIVGAAELIASLGSLGRSAGWERRTAALRVAIPAAVAFYLAVPLVEIPRAAGGGYLGGGDHIADTLRPSTVRDVSTAIDAHSRAGETVMSFWPGYLFGTDARPVPGFENDFATQGVRNAGYSESEARRQLLASPRYLADLIRRRVVRVIVIGPLGDWTKRHESLPLILRSGYRPVTEVGVTRIFVRGRPGRAAAIERCLRRAGLRAELSPPVRDASLVTTRLPGGGRAQVFVYPSAARALAAGPEVARFLRLDARAVRSRGPTVVAFMGDAEPAQARLVTGCADRPAGA